MLTEGRVRAIAVQVALAIVRKFNPNISEEQIAAVQKNAESAIDAKAAAEEAAARAEEAANRLLGVAVVGVIDENGKLVLTGLLEDGTYTAYYELTNSDGTKSLLKIGELTLAEEETPEPEPVTYTVTFVADGITVAEEKYTMDNPVVNEPTVPAKDGYTGAWADYDLSQGGDIIVNAVYTEIGGEATTHTVTWVDDDGTVLEIDTVADGDTPEYNGAAPATTKVVGEEDPYTYNFVGWTPKVGAVNADTTYKVTYADWGYKSGYRIRSSGAEAAQAGVYCTDYIPVSYDDTVYIKGVTKHATTGYNSIVFYKTDGDTQIAFTDFTNEDLSYDSKNDIYSFKVWSGFISALTENWGVARFRFSCGGISEDTIITVNESIE